MQRALAALGFGGEIARCRPRLRQTPSPSPGPGRLIPAAPPAASRTANASSARRLPTQPSRRALDLYTTVKPLADRVLLKTKTAEQKTTGGILLPSTAQSKPQSGEVVAVGEGRTIGDSKVEVGIKHSTTSSTQGGRSVRPPAPPTPSSADESSAADSLPISPGSAVEMDREAKKEGFRKYLESSGVLDTLTKALVSLYEENDKPSSAVEFVQQKLGGPSISDYEKLKAEKLDLQLKYNELLETHKETSRQLEELKNLKIDAPWN
ncbi:hypothetical protein ZWY2020_046425 [Hordeum vulgare]|nr:hypothetical protein ZWY2020_046425 [Hordeum vulgare]